MKILQKIVVPAFFCLTCCAGSFEESVVLKSQNKTSRDKNYCRSLDDDKMFWGSISKFSGSMTGASGIGSIVVSDDKTKLYLQISSVTFASISLASMYLEQGKSISWVRECSK